MHGHGQPVSDETEKLLLASFDARTAAWSQWGRVDSDVLGHLVNPTFMGGPRWPALRQAFRIVRRETSILVASDGLSDPFEDDDDPGVALENGFGVELYAASSDGIDQVVGSWLLGLVWQVSQFAADRGDLLELLGEYDVLSTELHNVQLPSEFAPRFVNAAGRVGVLLGMRSDLVPSIIDGPFSPIRLVSAKLLAVDELQFIVDGGPEARVQLAQQLREQGLDIQSGLTRPSVLEDHSA